MVYVRPMNLPADVERTGALCTPTRALLWLSLGALGLALWGGLLSALYYLPASYPWLKRLGVQMHQTHSIHTSFAVAWIYLAALAFLHEIMHRHRRFSRAERRRITVQLGLWTLAGVGIAVTLAAKIYSGREYVEYHPAFGVLILGGWALFAWNFLLRVWRGFWSAPVYVFMWTISCGLFVFTYAEQNAWRLLPFGRYAVADIQLQWKSLGAMIGSFNLLVYGISMYLGERISGNRAYAQSKMGFALFGVGLLNSFTNYAHHTYHLPQSALVKWIAFVVSMLEVVILTRALFDLLRPTGCATAEPTPTERFLASAKWWSLGNLVLAILISVPPLNTLIHGTLVVVAHAMGSTIGIDTMVLFAAVSALLPAAQVERWLVVGLNLSLGLLVAALAGHGLVKGYVRYLGLAAPAWQGDLHVLFVIGGLCSAAIMLVLITRWARALRARP